MKKFQWPLRAFLFVGLLQLISCTKAVDSTENSINADQSSDLTFPVTNEFSICKLRRIYQQHPDGPYTISGLFTYNGAGNPVSVTFTDVTAEREIDSYPNQHFFTYDKQGRLKEYRSEGDGGFGRHSYGYDENNRIAIDTANSGFGSSVFVINISTFTYDGQGRIIKETIRNIRNFDNEGGVHPLLPTRNPTFTYDARGNLAVAGWKSSSYDNKVSIFRSHPVFQFIFRNYSRNNLSVQPKYNSKGLPLSVVPGNDIFFNFKSVTKAIYDCQ
jgi:hypothetical protein